MKTSILKANFNKCYYAYKYKGHYLEMEAIYFVTSLQVWEGDRIFDQSKAEVRFSVTFKNLEAGDTNV